MNNWITIQPASTQDNGSRTIDIAMTSTLIFDNSYNSNPKWIQPIQIQQTTHPYEPTPMETSYGNEKNVSKSDPDNITSSDPLYGLETSVSNSNKTLNSKTSKPCTKLEF